MKRLAFVLASVLLATGVWAQGAPAADTIMVVGSVVNSVDNYALPYCKVFLLQDGRHIATGNTACTVLQPGTTRWSSPSLPTRCSTARG